MFDTSYASLSPAGVVAAALIAPPSVELLGALDGIDVEGLDARLQVDVMVAWERCAAWVVARQLPVIAAVGDTAFAAASECVAAAAGLTAGERAQIPYRAAHAEIGCALRLSPQPAEARLRVAHRITGVLPMVYRSLLDGDISFRHAVAIAEATVNLDDAADACWVAARVLPKARRQTVAELRRALRTAVQAVCPKDAAGRHAKAVAERKVSWFDLDDGMAELRVTSSASDIEAVYNTLDAVARKMANRTPEGVRIPIDSRRAAPEDWCNAQPRQST